MNVVDTTHRIAGVTGVILAGGQSSRMGSNKALLPCREGRFIEAIHRRIGSLFDQVLLVTNVPEQYRFLGCAMVPDIFPGMGALAGLHSGLYHSRTPHVFVVGCDMPCLNDRLIRALASCRTGADVVVPEGEEGVEPLHAVYSRSCLPYMAGALRTGRRRIVSFFPEVAVNVYGADRVRLLDPAMDSFRNINTPDDYYRLRDREQHRRLPRREAAAG